LTETKKIQIKLFTTYQENSKNNAKLETNLRKRFGGYVTRLMVEA